LNTSVPRSEYPRPQFTRQDWLCLNGIWQFQIDREDSGALRGLPGAELGQEILVPFCPESSLSGVGETGFMDAVWYRRTTSIPDDWIGRRLLLHFQAVDYDTTVWVDGVEVVRHRGGWTPFSADLGVVGGRDQQHTIVVRARDPRSGNQPRGKQSDRDENYGTVYTRTTGIWQTVWLEPVPETYMLRPRITPDMSGGSFHVDVGLRGPTRGLSVRATLSDGSRELVSAESRADLDFNTRLTLVIPAENRREWSPDDPFLYGLSFEVVDSQRNAVDRIRSYGGLRSLTIADKAVLLNGEPRFQRLVLDQGYYPDGGLTAPSDEALVRDIELSMAAGFNGARLHQKVFEERFLYHCDRLGYLVWGEFGDWAGHAEFVDRQQPDRQPTAAWVAQWLEAVERDYSHPSIVGWCPLNETSQSLSDRITVLDDVTRAMFLATKALDQTRPVLDASGFSHRIREVDVYDVHDYEQDVTKFAAAVEGLASGEPPTDLDLAALSGSIPYADQPLFCSEFGGIWWDTDSESGGESWGYGNRPASVDEFYSRFEGLVSVLLENKNMFGYCYTQLTDVYQERNGIYRFDRSPKFELERIRGTQARPAAIEKAWRGPGDEPQVEIQGRLDR
jgi:beta-galactosidase/beta-glucuronidase